MEIEQTPQSVLTLLVNGYDVVRKKSLLQETPFLLFKEAMWDRRGGGMGTAFWLWSSGPIDIPGAPCNNTKSVPWGNRYMGMQADTLSVGLIRIESNSEQG